LEDEEMTMKTLVQKVLTGTIAIAGLVAAPGVVQAGPINGFIGISGGITYDTVGTGGSAILDWSPVGGGVGRGFVVTDATGYFNPDGGGLLGIDIGTSLAMRDLTNDLSLAGPAPQAAYAPPGAASVPNFLSNFVDPDTTIAPLTNLHYDLTEMVRQTAFPACTGAEHAGSTCVLGDIFVLTETNGHLSILLDVRGNFVNGADSGYYKGGFSTTFTDLTFQTAYARLAAGQNLDCPSNATVDGRTSCTFDANFTPISAIPEPASLVLFGTGATWLALRKRRNAKKQG
jgi:hypothetical protein